jgi:hypothetical protein
MPNTDRDPTDPTVLAAAVLRRAGLGRFESWAQVEREDAVLLAVLLDQGVVRPNEACAIECEYGTVFATVGDDTYLLGEDGTVEAV